MLVLLNHDQISLAITIESRFVELCNLHERTTGTQLDKTTLAGFMILPAILLWRGLLARLADNDPRGTQEELQAIKDVAQWTVDYKMSLLGRPTKQVEFSW